MISNDGGDAAKKFSIEWALKGNGVLLHPEGTVHWTGDKVHEIFPGIVEMPIEAANRTDKPVYAAPLIWKMQYTTDVSAALQDEMGYIEKSLSLPSGDGTSLPSL